MSAPLPTALPELQTHWTDGDDFLTYFEGTASDGTVLVPVSASHDLPEGIVPGALIRVVLSFTDREIDFRLHARVEALERHRRGAALRLRFLPEQRDRLELVLACAAGDGLPHYQRRRHERYTVCLPVRLFAVDRRVVEGEATSISAGGIRVTLDEPPAPGAPIQLEIDVPGAKQPLKLGGRIAWVNLQGLDRGVGIAFALVSPQHRIELTQYLDRLRHEAERGY